MTETQGSDEFGAGAGDQYAVTADPADVRGESSPAPVDGQATPDPNEAAPPDGADPALTGIQPDTTGAPDAEVPDDAPEHPTAPAAAPADDRADALVDPAPGADFEAEPEAEAREPLGGWAEAGESSHATDPDAPPEPEEPGPASAPPGADEAEPPDAVGTGVYDPDVVEALVDGGIEPPAPADIGPPTGAGIEAPTDAGIEPPSGAEIGASAGGGVEAPGADIEAPAGAGVEPPSGAEIGASAGGGVEAPGADIEAPAGAGVEVSGVGVEAPAGAGVEIPDTGIETPDTGIEAPAVGIVMPDPPGTGEVRVDEAVAALQHLGDRPTEEHVSAYEATHGGLQDVLADLDRDPDGS